MNIKPSKKLAETAFDLWENIHEAESAAVFFLTGNGRMLGWSMIAKGSRSYVSIRLEDITDLMKQCSDKPVQVVVVHNHPNGYLIPSGFDLATTAKLKQMVEDAGGVFQDHVIIGPDRGAFYSFKLNNIL